MIFIRRLKSILWWFARRDRAEQNLKSELEAFVDIAAAEKIRNGTPPDEARRQARVELGGVEQVKEQVRMGRHGGFLDVLLQDLRMAFRMMRNNRGFTTLSIVTLAMGIGGMTTIFSVVNGVLPHPLPWGSADRLVILNESYQMRRDGSRPLPVPPADDWPQHNNVFEASTRSLKKYYTLSSPNGASSFDVELVGANFLTVLEARPLLGRGFVKEDTSEDRSAALLSYTSWITRFGGAKNILGTTLKFVEGDAVVIGVMPRGFVSPIFPTNEVWIAQSDKQFNASLISNGYARVKAGITGLQAEEHIKTVLDDIGRQHPEGPERHMLVHWIVGGAYDGLSNRETPTLLWILLASVGILLLIANINVANLLLARSVTRSREVVLRSALGAGRARLVRQFLTESLLLGLVGGICGLLLAAALLNVIVAQLPSGFPRVAEIYLDGRVFAFAALVSLVSSVLFGILPALSASRNGIQGTLQEGTRLHSGSRRQLHLRQLLAAVEVGLATMLLIGAALIGMTSWKVINVPLGLDSNDVVTAQIRFPSGTYLTPTERQTFRDLLTHRIQSYPEVSSSTFTSAMPLINASKLVDPEVSEKAKLASQAQGKRVSVIATEVTRGYFETLKVSFKIGRVFTDGENAVVINETMGQRYWPNSNPVGEQIKLGLTDDSRWFTVVGVVPDQNRGITGGSVKSPEVYEPCDSCGVMLVRTSANPTRVAEIIRRETAAIDAKIRLDKVQSLDSVLMQNPRWANPRFRFTLFLTFSATALLLAFAGVYGVTSYSAARRTQEIGIRMTLGARRRNLVGLMLAQSMLPLLLGVSAGLLAAWNLSRFVAAYLIDVSSRDLTLFAAAAGFTALVMLIANLLPIHRAASVDPLRCIRCE